jgi:3-hydroxybutyryl-CoA dehydrogenase
MAVAGSGAIATGLAAVAAAKLGDVVVVARSEESAERARAKIAKALEKLEGDGEVTVSTDLDLLADCTYVVEAIAEDFVAKSELLAQLSSRIGPQAILATTTSSLSVQELGEASGRPERFVALHVFNPVPRMDLIEVAYTDNAMDTVRSRTAELCESLGKVGIEVPDTPGFVVNRVLFPMLFDAARMLEGTGLTAGDVDNCMKMGAGHPMGPLALLDFVGLDVSIAIGESIGADIPQNVRDLAAEGALGRKAGRGFHTYEKSRV